MDDKYRVYMKVDSNPEFEEVYSGCSKESATRVFESFENCKGHDKIQVVMTVESLTKCFSKPSTLLFGG